MRYIIRRLCNLFSYKHIDESRLDVLHITLNRRDVSYFNLSSNAILSFWYNDKLYYFRECPPICKREMFFKNAIKHFFETLGQLNIAKEHFKQEVPINLCFSEEETSTFQQYILKLSKSRAFLKKMTKVDQVSEKNAFSIWKHQIYANDFFASYGLVDIDPSLYDIAVYYLWYMRSVATTYRTAHIVRGKHNSYFAAVRSISTQLVAESLGLQGIVTNSRLCRIHFEDGTSLLGVLSDAAPGNRCSDVAVVPEGSLQRKLMSLHLLDVICFQPDHGPNNYNVTPSDNGYTVCAFDNDNPNTFFPWPFITQSFLGCSPLVDRNGFITRPYISRTIAEKICKLNIKGLEEQLNPYLNLVQRFAFGLRVRGLQTSIKKSISHKKLELLEDDEWDYETVNKELNGNYGVTYLILVNQKGKCQRTEYEKKEL